MLRIIFIAYLFSAANALLIVALERMLGFEDRRAAMVARGERDLAAGMVISANASKEQLPC